MTRWLDGMETACLRAIRHLDDVEVAVVREVVAVASGAASATEPHAWHSPHRPTHFAVSQPHSLHRKEGRVFAVVLLMPGTLGQGADSSREVTTDSRLLSG